MIGVLRMLSEVKATSRSCVKVKSSEMSGRGNRDILVPPQLITDFSGRRSIMSVLQYLSSSLPINAMHAPLDVADRQLGMSSVLSTPSVL